MCIQFKLIYYDSNFLSKCRKVMKKGLYVKGFAIFIFMVFDTLSLTDFKY